eukprot:103173-Prymnesium_polylepis.2
MSAATSPRFSSTTPYRPPQRRLAHTSGPVALGCPTRTPCVASSSWLMAISSVAFRMRKASSDILRKSVEISSGPPSKHQHAKCERCSTSVRPTLPTCNTAHVGERMLRAITHGELWMQ